MVNIENEAHDPMPGAVRAYDRAGRVIDALVQSAQEARRDYPETPDIMLASELTNILMQQVPSSVVWATVASVAIMRLADSTR